MGRYGAFWHPEQERIYTETALVVYAKAEEERLTPRLLAGYLDREALAYIHQLPCGHDESPVDTFMDDLHRGQIIDYDNKRGRYTIGVIGRVMVSEFLEQWAGNP